MSEAYDPPQSENEVDDRYEQYHQGGREFKRCPVCSNEFKVCWPVGHSTTLSNQENAVCIYAGDFTSMMFFHGEEQHPGLGFMKEQSRRQYGVDNR